MRISLCFQLITAQLIINSLLFFYLIAEGLRFEGSRFLSIISRSYVVQKFLCCVRSSLYFKLFNWICSKIKEIFKKKRCSFWCYIMIIMMSLSLYVPLFCPLHFISYQNNNPWMVQSYKGLSNVPCASFYGIFVSIVKTSNFIQTTL